uniref:Uncharacterized protein n=1 Tax=Arundo donax TaxID=35708 RepID=A0A0A9CP04_ARUDO
MICYCSVTVIISFIFSIKFLIGEIVIILRSNVYCH